MKPDRTNSPASADGLPKRPRPAVPNHEMLRLIGSGSYGEVWLARHTVLNSYCAVKVVYRDRFLEDRPFERELEGIQRFEPVSRSHPSQVNILGVGRSEGTGSFYYAMELADDQRAGQQIDPRRYIPKTLRSELNQRGRLPVADCLRIGLALTTALEHLHHAGLIHRDIKPANVIFVSGLPKLADIGLVAEAQEACSFVGTVAYVPPEGPGKPQADIYALGKVLYEMMTGLSANESSSLRPEEKYPSLPAGWANAADHQMLKELNEVVLRACDPKPERRYQTAEEMRADLVLLSSRKSLVRLRKLEHAYHRILVVLAAVAGMVMLLGLVGGFFFFRRSAAAENRRRELREVQISRMQLRRAGWFPNNWSRLEHAAKIRRDQEVREQASALLAGLDARPVRVLEGAAAASAAFGPDGRALAGGVGPNGPALMIDTNGVMTELPVRGEGPVCWASDGVPLQLVVATNRLVLREADTGNVRREFPLEGTGPLPPGSPPVLAVTPGGSRVAAGLGRRVFVWEAASGELLGEVAGGATALAFSPDGSLLGAGSADGTTRVYAVPGLAQTAVLPPALRGNPILCLAFARDHVVRYGVQSRTNSWLLAAGDQGAGIVIWDLDRRQPRSICRGSTWIVTALAFHPDGLTLASAGRNEPRLWDVTSGQLLLCLRDASSGESRALAFDREGRRLVCGGVAGPGPATVALWQLEPNHGVQALRGLASSARKVWFSANSARLAALSDDWHLGVWEAASGRLLFLFETPDGSSYADSAGGCFDASGQRFAFATGREACLFDLRSGDVLQRWRLAEGASDQLQFDARGRWLLLRRERPASGPQKWVWRLHELGASEAPVLLHEQRATNWAPVNLFFAPGGGRFLVWHPGGEGGRNTILACDAASGLELWKAATQGTNPDLRVCADPSGRWFAYTAYASMRLRLMRFSDFREIGTAAEHCEAISPFGLEFVEHELISDRKGSDRTPLATDWTALSWVSAFSPDGTRLAWGTEEGVVLVASIQEVRRRLAGLGK
ncbi:MAG TPA: protein kinase [Dongiaceae bacterium]|nr:protein kinase [Dongiaceae bacterium]